MTTLTHSTRTDSFLRLTMRADAILTGFTGILGLPLAAWLAKTCGTTVAFEQAMAAFYIAYGVVVFGLSRLRSVQAPGMAVILANVLYTVGAVALVLLDVFPLTTIGVVLILASGVYTLVFAELQYAGWKRARA